MRGLPLPLDLGPLPLDRVERGLPLLECLHALAPVLLPVGQLVLGGLALGGVGGASTLACGGDAWSAPPIRLRVGDQRLGRGDLPQAGLRRSDRSLGSLLRVAGRREASRERSRIAGSFFSAWPAAAWALGVVVRRREMASRLAG